MNKNKENKGFSGVKIWDFLNKIPAGTMFIPLIISAIVTTISIQSGLGTGKVGEGISLWDFFGSPIKDLFGSSGQMLVLGLMLFCTGTMVKPHDFVEFGKRGIWNLLSRLIPAYAICTIVYFTCGINGFCGINWIALCAVLTSSNAALFMGIITPYADNSDRAAFPILLITSMPLLPFIFISAFGVDSSSADATSQLMSKTIQIVSLLLPFILGFILGNLDPKIREVFKGGNTILMPFLGFQFGSTINLVKAFQGRILLAALLLTVIYLAVTSVIPFVVDFFILKRPGYFTMASCSTAGVSLSIPAMFASYSFNGIAISGTDIISDAIAILAFTLFVTNILSPFLTKLEMTWFFKYNHKRAVTAFKDTHPELLETNYDENGNYIKKQNRK